MILRRAFLASAGVSLISAPSLVRAQEKAKVRRIAIISFTIPATELTEEKGQSWFVAFFRELRRLGYREGDNLIIDRWSGQEIPDRDELVGRLVASRPEVIFCTAIATIGPPLVAATKTIPIVGVGQDPERYGLVSSFSHPGGNFTAFTADPGREILGKYVQLLFDFAPKIKRLAFLTPRYLWDVNAPFVSHPAGNLGLEAVPVFVDLPYDELSYRRAFASMADLRIEAVLVGGGSEANANTRLIAKLCLDARLPAIMATPDFSENGGLMTYASNWVVNYRGVAGYVARILNGERPGDLPIQQPTTFDLIINKKTADALGLAIPLGLQVFATEIIE